MDSAAATRSNGAASSSSARLLAAAVFHRRARSRNVVTPRSRAEAQMRTTSSCGKITPPARLCVFSVSTNVVGGSIM
jgi:hypothetical protein